MWFYASSNVSEDWRGPHDTLDDALEAARSDYAGVQESFWVDEAHPVNWDRVKRSFLDADDVLERFAEYVGDNESIEDPEPEFKVSKAAAQEALERWAVEHLSMRDYWQCVGKAVVYPVAPPAVAGERPVGIIAHGSGADPAVVDACAELLELCGVEAQRELLPDVGERAIVVGSTWLETSRNLKRVVKGLNPHHGIRAEYEQDGRTSGCWFSVVVFRRLFTWISDPPTPATGGEGEA